MNDRKTYDTKCWDIAEYFLADVTLSDDEKRRWAHELAYEIQQVIEDCLRDVELGANLAREAKP